MSCRQCFFCKGAVPKSEHAVKNAVARVMSAGTKKFPTTKYENCGRRYGPDGGKYKLTKEQTQKLVDFVKKWRAKRFCTCRYMKRELKLDCTIRTIARALNRHGYHWRPVAKKTPLSPKHLALRKVFVNTHLLHSPSWWVQNMHLVFDGVTLTKAPKNLDLRHHQLRQNRLSHRIVDDDGDDQEHDNVDDIEAETRSPSNSPHVDV